MDLLPDYWTRFIHEHGLEQAEISVPEEDDASGVGVDLQVFDEAMATDEATNFYPGIAVAKDGFVPVAGCTLGSGDPYFIDVNDGEGGPLYRVYHDAAGPDGYDRAEAVAVVLKSYEELPRYLPGKSER